MLLTVIRRNVINGKSTMSPDEVVTTIGLRTFGQMRRTLRDNGAEYEFTWQDSKFLVLTTPVPPVSYMTGIISPFSYAFDNRDRISELAFERSDGTRVKFNVRKFEPRRSGTFVF